jgi:hypothetical protein
MVPFAINPSNESRQLKRDHAHIGAASARGLGPLDMRLQSTASTG